MAQMVVALEKRATTTSHSEPRAPYHQSHLNNKGGAMKYESWKKFADFQNGQNIRLESMKEYIEDAISETEKVIDRENDPDKEVLLEFVLGNLKIIKGKAEDALDRNALLKEIVESDYRGYEIKECDFEITGLEKDVAWDNHKVAKLTLLVDNDGKRDIVSDELFLVEWEKPKITSLFESVGLKKRGIPYKMKWSDLIGKTGRAFMMAVDNECLGVFHYLDPEKGDSNDR